MKIIYLMLAAWLIGACNGGVPTPTAPVGATATPTALRPVAVIAHRGGAALAPENTLGAFRKAIALGVDVIEMDTHLSKDGAVVVIHDPTLERTSDGSGRVADWTLAQLQELNAAAKFGDGKYERQPVPAFGQALDLVQSARLRVEVEIKVPPQGRYPGIEQKLVKEITDRSLIDRVQVSSFDFAVLADVKRVNSKARTVALMSYEFFRRAPVDFPAQAIDEARNSGAEVIAVNKDLLTRALVDEAHARGMQVEVWTVDSETDMKKFVQMGVDGIISNKPDVLKTLTR